MACFTTMEEEEGEDPLPFELVCAVCKGSDFVEEGYFKTCADCGTQLHGHVEEIDDVFHGGNLGGASTKRKQRNKRKRKEIVYEPQIELRPSAEVAFEAFQCVLQALLGALISRCGCDAEVASEVRALWFRVVPLCAEAIAETIHLQRVPTMATTRKREITLSPSLALALCHLGCLRCALPVRIDDLLAWGRADVLPLMTAHLELPARLQPVAQWLPSAARPVETPSWGTAAHCPGLLGLPPGLLAALRSQKQPSSCPGPSGRLRCGREARPKSPILRR